MSFASTQNEAFPHLPDSVRPTQVGGALIEAFGPYNCIGTYAATPTAGFIQFDMQKAAFNPQLAEDLMETVSYACHRLQQYHRVHCTCNSPPLINPMFLFLAGSCVETKMMRLLLLGSDVL